MNATTWLLACFTYLTVSIIEIRDFIRTYFGVANFVKVRSLNQ